jgi:serine/threonine-protein kinase RsbW
MPGKAAELPVADDLMVSMAYDSLSVREGLRQSLSQDPLKGLAPDDRGTAEIVLAEVLNNIVEHAYASFPGKIRLHLSLGQGVLVCRVEDDGVAMPTGAAPNGRLSDPNDLPEGGFGWHLIRTLSTDLVYERDGPMNRLRFSLPAEQSGV